jgi:anti-sigma-K factor RskA
MSPGHATRHEELLPAYALGALDGEDLRELEAHLATGCEECRRQLDLWQGDVEELAASVEPVTPSEETRRRIQRLAGVGTTATAAPVVPIRRPSGSARPIARWALLAAAASLLIAAGSLWRQARLGDELERLGAERDRLAREVSGLGQQLGLARSESQRMAESLAIIASPGSHSVQLAGLDAAPKASGHTYVNPQRGEAVFYAFGLPAPEPGKTYQLWWIQDGKPVSAGTFGVDERGSGSLRVEHVAPAGQIQAWAVTVEPAGGVPQPTGAMVLKG